MEMEMEMPCKQRELIEKWSNNNSNTIETTTWTDGSSSSDLNFDFVSNLDVSLEFF